MIHSSRYNSGANCGEELYGFTKNRKQIPPVHTGVVGTTSKYGMPWCVLLV